jgi:hypothetical protein
MGHTSGSVTVCKQQPLCDVVWTGQMGSINYGLENFTHISTGQRNKINLKHLAVLCH